MKGQPRGNNDMMKGSWMRWGKSRQTNQNIGQGKALLKRFWFWPKQQRHISQFSRCLLEGTSRCCATCKQDSNYAPVLSFTDTATFDPSQYVQSINQSINHFHRSSGYCNQNEKREIVDSQRGHHRVVMHTCAAHAWGKSDKQNASGLLNDTDHPGCRLVSGCV